MRMSDSELLDEVVCRLDDDVFRLCCAMTIERNLHIFEVYPEHVHKLRTMTQLWDVLQDVEVDTDQDGLIEALAARLIADCE